MSPIPNAKARASTDRVKRFIEELTAIVNVKAPCVAASWAPIDLRGEQTIDGILCVSGDRVLVRAQIAARQNGIYVVAKNEWKRAADFDATRTITFGTTVPVKCRDGAEVVVYKVVTEGHIVVGETNIEIANSSFASDSGKLSFTQAGRGAVVRTVKDKLRDIVSVKDFGAVGDGTNDDTEAFQSAIDAARRIWVPSGVYKLSRTLSMVTPGQVIYGDGDSSVLECVHDATGITFGGKYYGEINRLRLSSSFASVGIDIPRLSHHWQISRCHIVGFSTAGVRAASAFCGKLEHCDIETNAIGFLASAEVNGCVLANNSFRQNLIGVSLEDRPSSSAGNTIIGNVIESARRGSLYGIQVLGSDSNMIHCNRIEYTAGSSHVIIRGGSTRAQFNQMIGNVLEGTVAAIILGGGEGRNNVMSTFVLGGRAAGAITIHPDCTYTHVTAAPASYPQKIVDNGYGSVVDLDRSTSGKYYARGATSNSRDKSIESLTGNVAHITNFNDLKYRLDFALMSEAFQFYVLSPTGKPFPVMRFGAYRIWISPSNGKLYIKGADPDSDTDGTAVGTQT